MSFTLPSAFLNPISHGVSLIGPISPSLFPIFSPPSSSIQLKPSILQLPFRHHKSSPSATNAGGLGEAAVDFDWGEVDDGGVEVEDEGSPWEGAVLYRRNSSVSHLEYCTTLERLGLGKISSELSRSRASAMGLRVTKAVKEFVDGTPVLVSVDVTRNKRNVIRLDGIIRTVLSLSCNRCGEPAAESIFCDFSLLLTEDPVNEPETINMGVIYGEDKSNSDEDEAIDIEDRLYFPPQDKQIDISKHIRDLVHLEITINAICDPECKGLCLKCGINLNTSGCSCENEVKDVVSRPLGNLRKQMDATTMS